MCSICKNSKSSDSSESSESEYRVCYKCVDKALDRNGNPVKFSNIDVFGGFKSIHYINNKYVENNDHICYINGIKCIADEARFGGIIVRMK